MNKEVEKIIATEDKFFSTPIVGSYFLITSWDLFLILSIKSFNLKNSIVTIAE